MVETPRSRMVRLISVDWICATRSTPRLPPALSRQQFRLPEMTHISDILAKPAIVGECRTTRS
jgi:hypothetical protein